MGIVKVLIGAGLIIGSVYSIFQFPFLLSSLKVVLAGVIPILVILIGIFIVWLELDEMRIERELRKAQKKKK